MIDREVDLARGLGEACQSLIAMRLPCERNHPRIAQYCFLLSTTPANMQWLRAGGVWLPGSLPGIGRKIIEQWLGKYIMEDRSRMVSIDEVALTMARVRELLQLKTWMVR